MHALSPELKLPGFGVESCFIPYLSALPKAFASSNLSVPSLHRRALRFRLPEIASGEGRGYYVPHSWSFRWLRCILYAESTTVPCRQF